MGLRIRQAPGGQIATALGTEAIPVETAVLGDGYLTTQQIANLALGWYNVKASPYNAVGNGIADDTTAIQAAMNAAQAAGGGTVFFPAGTYIVSTMVASVGGFDPNKALVAPSNVTLLGEGYESCLQSSVSGGTNVGFSFVTNAGFHANTPQSNITVRGLRFRRTNALNGGEGPYDGAITMRLVDILTVDDCIFESSLTGVGVEGCTHYMVRNCRGFSQGDATVRISGLAGGASALGSTVDNCSSDNAGFALDGVTPVPTPGGPVGSAIVCTQDDVRIVDCVVRNSRGQAVELGGSFDGVSQSHNIVIEDLYSITNIAGRTGSVLVASTDGTVVKNCEFRCYANTTSLVRVEGNLIPNTNIDVDGCTFWTSNAGSPPAGYGGPGVSVKEISSFVTVRNCTAIGGWFNADTATSSDVIFENCESILSPSVGFHLASGTRQTLKNCRAINAGNDTTLPADYSRAGIMVDSVNNPRVEGCTVLETRAGGARTQLYGFGTNGTGMTVAWKGNYTDGNNVTDQYLTTGTVTRVFDANTVNVPVRAHLSTGGTNGFEVFDDNDGGLILSMGSAGNPYQGKLKFIDPVFGHDTLAFYNAAANVLVLEAASLAITRVGSGLQIAEGANAKMGVATLVLGTVVVSTTAVTATSRIQLTAQSLGTVTVPSALAVSARTAGTSFTILASALTDTSVVAWEIIEPA